MMHKKINWKKGNTQQKGLAVVEFALILPILLFLMLATAEFGKAFYEYNTLTKTIRDGARFLANNALDGTTGLVDVTAANETAAKNIVVYGNQGGTGTALLDGLVANDITIAEVGDDHVSVTAAYNYIPIYAAGIPSFGIGTQAIATNFVFNASTTMRALR